MRKKIILILIGILVVLVAVYLLALSVTPKNPYQAPIETQSNFKGPGNTPMKIQGPTEPPPGYK